MYQMFTIFFLYWIEAWKMQLQVELSISEDGILIINHIHRGNGHLDIWCDGKW